MRRPVVLVPGWSDRARHLRRLRHHLIDAGWPPDQVVAIDFRDRYGSNIEHAAEIAAALRLASGNDQSVDVVAHSMGGLAVRYLLGRHPEGRLVRRAIFMATPHRGTWAAYIGWGAGAAQMRIGSSFLRELASPSAVEAELLTIRTPVDFRIFPGTSAELRTGRDHRIWCLGHRALLHSRRVHRLVQTLLES
jgi:triacylglycerol lipase